MLHPENSSKAGTLIAEKIVVRGFTSAVAAKQTNARKSYSFSS